MTHLAKPQRLIGTIYVDIFKWHHIGRTIPGTKILQDLKSQRNDLIEYIRDGGVPFSKGHFSNFTSEEWEHKVLNILKNLDISLENITLALDWEGKLRATCEFSLETEEEYQERLKTWETENYAKGLKIHSHELQQKQQALTKIANAREKLKAKIKQLDDHENNLIASIKKLEEN